MTPKKGDKRITRRFLEGMKEDVLASVDDLTTSIETLGRAVSAEATRVATDLNALKERVTTLQGQVSEGAVTASQFDALKAAVDSITASIVAAGMAEPESHVEPEAPPAQSTYEPPL